MKAMKSIRKVARLSVVLRYCQVPGGPFDYGVLASRMYINLMEQGSLERT